MSGAEMLLKVLWHPDVLLHDTGEGVFEAASSPLLAIGELHPESAPRILNMKAILERGPLAQRLEWASVPVRSDDVLERVHTPAYVEEVRHAAAHGGRRFTATTVLGAGSWPALMAAASAAMQATKLALAETVPTYALIRPPGHHAQPDRADGYCFFNNAALGVEEARRGGAERVAVIDFDVHHGNGTQECFWTRSDVLTVSIHMDHGAWGASHPQTGAVTELGAGPGAGFNLNIPLPLGTGDAGYARAMTQIVMPVVQEFKPDLVIAAVGQDACQFDPNGRQALSMEGFRTLGELLRTIAQDSAGGEWLEFFLGELQAEGWLGGAVGIEKWSSVPNRATSEILETALAQRGCTVVDGSLVTRRVRRLKSAAEIELMRRAAAVCDAGLRALRATLAPGVTELEAWSEMVSAMVAAGGEPAVLQENVWVGTNHLIHALSSRRPLGAGDIVCADPCGVVRRYHANAARPFSIGEPEPAAVALMELLAEGARLFQRTAVAGASVSVVAATLRDYYQDAGIWDHRGWLGGYELGVALPPDWVGEWMFAVDGTDNEGTFEEGLVTNYESVAGLVLIDTFVIGADGVQRLSSIPQELLIATG